VEREGIEFIFSLRVYHILGKCKSRLQAGKKWDRTKPKPFHYLLDDEKRIVELAGKAFLLDEQSKAS
jgi:hypothetical protein